MHCWVTLYNGGGIRIEGIRCSYCSITSEDLFFLIEAAFAGKQELFCLDHFLSVIIDNQGAFEGIVLKLIEDRPLSYKGMPVVSIKITVSMKEEWQWPMM